MIRKTSRDDKILGIFGLLITGLGWGAVGYQINGFWQGVFMGLCSMLVVGFCLVNINQGS